MRLLNALLEEEGSLAFAVTWNHWSFLYFMVWSGQVTSIFCWPCPVTNCAQKSEWLVGGWVALTLAPSSQKAAFLNIYSPHHLKDPSLKRKRKKKETKVSIFNMSQQRLQFVVLLTVTHRIKTIVIPNEKLNSQWWLVQNRLGYFPTNLSVVVVFKIYV